MRTHKNLLLLSVLALLGLVTSGCESVRPAQYAVHTPPTPLPPAAEPIAAPPHLPNSQPNLTRQSRPVAHTDSALEVDSFLLTASRFLEEGGALIERGEFEKGRAELNRAVEALLDAPPSHPQREALEAALQPLLDRISAYDLLTPARDGLDAAEGGASEEPIQGADAILRAAAQLDAQPLTFPVDPTLEDRVLEVAKASVSQLPLDTTEEVMRLIRYFETPGGRRTVVSGLRRMAPYKQTIYRIFDEEGIPRELIHLAQAESGFNPRAVSNKAASGMWQFMRDRGREYDLQQDKYVEDRFNPEKATRAAARHLRDLYRRFGDWYLVLAAYNWGPEAIHRAVERTGYADFWYLHRTANIPPETANHIPIIVAMAIMAKNPSAFGIEVPESLSLEFDEVRVDALTSLQLLADLAGVPVEAITGLNPSLLQRAAPADFLLRVPKGTGPAVQAGIERIPNSGRTLWRAHRVGAADDLATIAKLYKSQAKLIAGVNQLDQETVRAGDLLLVPLSR